jgi:hypothetical protein
MEPRTGFLNTQMQSAAEQRAVPGPAGTTVFNWPVSQQRGNAHNWNSFYDVYPEPTHKP